MPVFQAFLIKLAALLEEHDVCIEANFNEDIMICCGEEVIEFHKLDGHTVGMEASLYGVKHK